jgi:hypothetical protein
MIFTVSSQLRDRGWKYQMEGQFLEVYNEVVRWSTVLTITADSRSTIYSDQVSLIPRNMRSSSIEMERCL